MPWTTTPIIFSPAARASARSLARPAASQTSQRIIGSMKAAAPRSAAIAIRPSARRPARLYDRRPQRLQCDAGGAHQGDGQYRRRAFPRVWRRFCRLAAILGRRRHADVGGSRAALLYANRADQGRRRAPARPAAWRLSGRLLRQHWTTVLMASISPPRALALAAALLALLGLGFFV